jgi:hypothetical protein
MQKNIAGQKWTVFAFDRTDNTPKTGDASQITAKLSKDGAAGAATNDVNPTELESGYYEFDLTQGETDYDKLTIIPVSGTSDIQVVGSPGTETLTYAAFNANVAQTADNDTKLTTITGSNGVKITDNGITSAKFATNSILNSSLGDALITANKLANNSLANAAFAANAIQVGNIGDNIITAAKLNADCITNDKIADDAIAAENLATDAISADALSAAAIQKIIDKEVDNDGGSTPISLGGAQKLMLAVLTGITSGGGGNPLTFRKLIDGTSIALSVTSDPNGNRTVIITRDAT